MKKGTGNYTVVFQSGLGSSHAIWRDIQNDVSQYAVTISYDRNGLMHSESNGLAVTNGHVTEELNDLLKKAGCPGPFIIVGHSMAGIYLRRFIKSNQQNIAGIVFVEAAHPLQIKRCSPELLKILKAPPYWLAYLAVNSGLYRLLFSFLPISPEIPKNHWLHKAEKNFFYKSYKKLFEEISNDKSNMEDACKFHDFGSIPLTIIKGATYVHLQKVKNKDLVDEYKSLSSDLQDDLLTLSSNSKMVEAQNSGHLVQINDGELITREILKLIRISEQSTS
ncbi:MULTISPECIES: alpha/beta hydrolase [Chitinophagaceae]